MTLPLQNNEDLISYTEILRELVLQTFHETSDIDAKIAELKNKRDLNKFTKVISDKNLKKKLDKITKSCDDKGKTPYFDRSTSQEFIKFISLYENDIDTPKIASYKKFRSGKIGEMTNSEWFDVFDAFSVQLGKSLGTDDEKNGAFTAFIDAFNLYVQHLEWKIRTELKEKENSLFERVSQLPKDRHEEIAQFWFNQFDAYLSTIETEIDKFEQKNGTEKLIAEPKLKQQEFEDELSEILDSSYGRAFVANYPIDNFEFSTKDLQLYYGAKTMDEIDWYDFDENFDSSSTD